MFLIQGCFFQNQEWLGLRTEPIEGTVCVIEKGLIWDMFAGIIRHNPNFPPQLIGGMLDHYGESILSDIEINDIQVRFTKRYERRSDEILYSFKVKEGNTWAGKYSGEAVGKGLSRCVITEVDDSFSDQRKLMKLVGSKTIHTWRKR